jgi:hypothetical protein
MAQGLSKKHRRKRPEKQVRFQQQIQTANLKQIQTANLKRKEI